MEVFEVVKIQGEAGKVLNVECSETEVRMLLTFAITELMNRGSISLLSDEDKAKLAEVESLLAADVKGTA